MTPAPKQALRLRWQLLVLVLALAVGSALRTRIGVSAERVGIRVQSAADDALDADADADADADVDAAEANALADRVSGEDDPSLAVDEAPSGDDGLEHANVDVPVSAQPHFQPELHDGVAPPPAPAHGAPKSKPKPGAAGAAAEADDVTVTATPKRGGLTPLTTEAQVIYENDDYRGNDTADGVAQHAYAHAVLPTGQVNVSRVVHRYPNGTVETIITTENATLWHENITVTPPPEMKCPAGDALYPHFCCVAKADRWLEPEQYALGGYCVFCPANCTCGSVCGECLCEDWDWEYEYEPEPKKRVYVKPPHRKVEHVKRKKKRRRVRRIRRARRKRIRKIHKKWQRPKHKKYVEPKRPAGDPIRKLVTPWGPLPDDFYTRQYAPQGPVRSAIDKPGCKPIYKPVNTGLVYPTVELTPKKLNYEGPITVSGKPLMSLINTGKALSFWLSALCQSKGTEDVPRVPGYAITQPLIQVKVNEGTPGVGPQEMQAFGAKAPTVIGGVDIGLQYFGAVFSAENVYGEAEQFYHDGMLGLGGLPDMPLHIPIIGHKSSMDALRDDLMLKQGLLLDVPAFPKWRKICSDTQTATVYKLFDPDGRYACLRTSRPNQLLLKSALPMLPLPLPLTPPEELFLVRERRRQHLKEELRLTELDPLWELERRLHIEAAKMKDTIVPVPSLPKMLAYAATAPARMAAMAADVAAASAAFPDLPKIMADLKAKAAENKAKAAEMKKEKEKKDKEEKEKKEKEEKEKKEKEKKDKEKDKAKSAKFRQRFPSDADAADSAVAFGSRARAGAGAGTADDHIKANAVLLQMRAKLMARYKTQFGVDQRAVDRRLAAEQRLDEKVAVRAGRLQGVSTTRLAVDSASGSGAKRNGLVIDGALERINADRREQAAEAEAAGAEERRPIAGASVSGSAADEVVVEDASAEQVKAEMRALVETEAQAESEAKSRVSRVRFGPELNLFFAYYLAEAGGCFVYGGWDQRFHSEPLRWFQGAHIPASWSLPLIDILYDGKSMGFCAAGCKAAFHTGSPLITGPMEKMIELQKKAPVNLLCVDLELLKPFEFIIGGQLDGGPPLRVVLEGKDFVRRVEVNGATNCISGFESQVRDIFVSEVWVMGVPFFKKYFSVFDWEAMRIGFAPSDPTFYDVNKCGTAGGVMQVVSGFECASPAELEAMREITVPTPPPKNPDGSAVFVPPPLPPDPPTPPPSPPAPGSGSPNEGPYVSPNPPYIGKAEWPENRDERDWDNELQHKLIEPVSGSAPTDKEEGPYIAKEKAFLAKEKALIADQLYFMGEPLANKAMQWDKEMPKALADAAKDWKTPPVEKEVKPWFFRQLFGNGDDEAEPAYGSFDSATERTLADKLGKPPPKTEDAMRAARERAAAQRRGARLHNDEDAEPTDRFGTPLSVLEAAARAGNGAELRGIDAPLLDVLPADSSTRQILAEAKKSLTRLDLLIENMQQQGTLPYDDPLLLAKRRYMAQKLSGGNGGGGGVGQAMSRGQEVARKAAAAGAARAFSETRGAAFAETGASARAGGRVKSKDTMRKAKAKPVPPSEQWRRARALRTHDKQHRGWGRVWHKYRDMYG